MAYWKVDEVTIKEAIVDALPDGYKAKVYQVSRKSHDTHFVQQLRTPSKSTGPKVYNLCDCLGNKFNFPLVVLGLNNSPCTHIKAVKSVTKHL